MIHEEETASPLLEAEDLQGQDSPGDVPPLQRLLRLRGLAR